jgi:hypothetical protein
MGWRFGGRSASTYQKQQSSLINQKRNGTRALGEFSLSIAPGNRLEIIFTSHWFRSSFALLQFSSILQFLPFDVRCSAFGVRRSAFDVHRPKEWWTPIRHAHEKPMCGENHFPLSPHGQAIRRSPLLVKNVAAKFLSLSPKFALIQKSLSSPPVVGGGCG